MTSLDVDSIFTNIALDETIDICIYSLYNDNEKYLIYFLQISAILKNASQPPSSVSAKTDQYFQT